VCTQATLRCVFASRHEAQPKRGRVHALTPQSLTSPRLFGRPRLAQASYDIRQLKRSAISQLATGEGEKVLRARWH
jgi:hypothetical protein